MTKTFNYSILVAGVALTIATGCKKNNPQTVPTLTSSTVNGVGISTASGGGTITSNGGATITATGICWSSKNNTPTTSDTTASGSATTGSFTASLANLQSNTTYYVRAFATNSAGTGYGNVITFSTIVDTTKVSFAYNGATVTYGVLISPKTGRKWMDRNLGASRVATSASDSLAFGDLFQWGRLADGHQLRTSDTTSVLSTTDVPVNSKFILALNNPATDWRSPSNDNLWQGSHGVNNPCPIGWHVPFASEWQAETGIVDSTSAYAQLKLTATSGYRFLDGTFVGKTTGRYWTASPISNGGTTYLLRVNATTVTSNTVIQRGDGLSIRCIRD